ncbi:MAG TPA: hypothetical protein VLK30_00340 [Candidatus Limnocylindrales bacterium]|nr:hypothetical protein [Candidatus Limnocylindrales bacterium]
METAAPGSSTADEPDEPKDAEPVEKPSPEPRPETPRHSRRRAQLAAAIAWVAGLVALTFPSYPVLPAIGIDPSWQIAMILAFQRHLSFGTDVIWIYGPYGWLDVPFFFDLTLPRIAILANIAGSVLFFTLLASQLWRRGAHALLWVVVALVIGLVVEWDAYITLGASLALSAILLLVSAFDATSARYRVGGPIAAGALLGLASLIKGSDFVVASALLVVALAYALLFQHRHLAVAPLGTVVSFVVFWVAAGDSVTAIPAYVRAVYEAASGYSGAMQRDQPYAVILGVAVLTIGLLVYGAAIALFTRDQLTAFALSLCAPVAFVVFKEGFVRHSYPSFVEPVLVILCVLAPVVVPRPSPSLLVLRSFRPAWWWVTGLMVGVLLTTYSGGPFFVENRIQAAASLRKVVSSTIDPSFRRQQQDRITAAIQDRYPLSAFDLATLRTGSVDVMPWDTDLVYGYGLDWRPRPVLQSYAAYTPYLDHADAAHLASSDSARYIVYYFYDYAGELDNRYAPYDEPDAYRALLENYRVLDTGGPLILERRTSPTSSDASALGSTCADVGAWISVPDGGSGRYVYANVRLPYSLAGRVLNTVYKPAPVFIAFQYGAGSTSPSYRLIDAVAGDGLLMSGYAADQSQFADLFQGQVDNPVTAFQVSVPSGSGDYAGQVCVDFVSRAAPASS